MSEGDGWTEAAVTVQDQDGNVLVLHERCTTCILGGRESIAKTLRPGKVREMVDQTRESGHIPCHSTLSNLLPGAAVCRGWWDAVAHVNQMIQVMSRLGFVRVVTLHEHQAAKAARLAGRVPGQ